MESSKLKKETADELVRGVFWFVK